MFLDSCQAWVCLDCIKCKKASFFPPYCFFEIVYLNLAHNFSIVNLGIKHWSPPQIQECPYWISRSSVKITLLYRKVSTSGEWWVINKGRQVDKYKNYKICRLCFFFKTLYQFVQLNWCFSICKVEFQDMYLNIYSWLSTTL